MPAHWLSVGMVLLSKCAKTGRKTQWIEAAGEIALKVADALRSHNLFGSAMVTGVP